MRIGELARRAGITTDAVRFYEERGLIASVRAMNGYREFSEDMLRQLLYVRTAQALGFSLMEIGDGLTQLLRRPSSAHEARQVLLRKIAMVDRRIAELRALRQELQARTKLDCPFAVKGTAPAAKRRSNTAVTRWARRRAPATSAAR